MKPKVKQILKILGIVMVCLIVAWNLGTKPSTTIVYTPGQVETAMEETSKSEQPSKVEEVTKPEKLPKVDEVTKPEELPKVDEVTKSEELPKVEEAVKPKEPSKVEEAVKPGAPSKTEETVEEGAKLKKSSEQEEAVKVETPKVEQEPKKEDTTRDPVRIEEAKTDQKAAKDLKKEIIDKSATTKKDKYLTDPTPEGKPKPVEPENVTINKENSFKVKLSITCETILNNMDLLDEAKHELVPDDSVIFPLQEVTAYEGESVFDVLLREVQNAGIHMEFEFTPMYNSAYIEGINNLYEFDVGELSGWMYKVNEWFPNYGCSRYQVKEGDMIEWVYTCDLGRDVGDVYIPPS